MIIVICNDQNTGPAPRLGSGRGMALRGRPRVESGEWRVVPGERGWVRRRVASSLPSQSVSPDTEPGHHVYHHDHHPPGPHPGHAG